MEGQNCCKSRLITFLVGSAILWVIWFLTNTTNLPWPVYPMAIWALVIAGGWLRGRMKCGSSCDTKKDESSCCSSNRQNSNRRDK